MYIIVGGTGHVGSVLSQHLLEAGEPVTIVSHSPEKAPTWEGKGAKVAIADINDVERLHKVLATGKRLYMLNPPANPKTDTDAVEKHTVACMLQALEGLNPERVVVHSTGGAQPADRCGDLGVLYDLEQGVLGKAYDAQILRAGYYFSNWDEAVEEARKSGEITSFYPENHKLPMVAPADLGRFAYELLATDRHDFGIHAVEGPERYSARDVAQAIGRIIGKNVGVNVIPEDEFEDAYRRIGFSDAAAKSYACMTTTTLHASRDESGQLHRGRMTLDAYFAENK